MSVYCTGNESIGDISLFKETNQFAIGIQCYNQTPNNVFSFSKENVLSEFFSFLSFDELYNIDSFPLFKFQASENGLKF